MTALLVPLLLWAVVVWRAPKALHHPNQRPLVIAFFFLAIVTTVRAPQTETLLRGLDLVLLLTVPKHLAGAVMTAAVLEFVARMIGPATNRRRSRHQRYAFTALMVTVMLAALPFVPRAEDGDFALGVGGSVPALIYWAAWLTHLGTMLTLASLLFFRQAHRAGSESAWRLQVGLTLSGAGTTIGLGYVANKLAFMVGSFPGGPGAPFSPDATAALNSALLNLSLLFVVVGTTFPAPFVGAAACQLRDLRSLAALYPLWRETSRNSPDVVLTRAFSSRWGRSTRFFLYRCVVEIEDGVLALHGHMQPGVDEAAAKAAHGLSAEDTEAFIEACRWRVALRAKKGGTPRADVAGAAPPAEDGAGEEWLTHEVRRLRRIARAYRSRPVRTLADSFPLPATRLQETSR
ncbi:MAB_1171c family putative transporter [Nocardiopsis sp. LOL_012]|uniref:MAB_1171c family putative transporter n=1 Tax=Nocardiopsis sp. LOL_012 TaxID=3345409 RepID=UPI003A88269C